MGAIGSAPSALTMMVTGGSRGLAQWTAHDGRRVPAASHPGGPGTGRAGGRCEESQDGAGWRSERTHDGGQ